MTPLRDFITQKYPQDQILEMFEATILPRDPNNSPHHTVRVAVTNNHLFVDQRMGEHGPTWEKDRLWLILIAIAFLLGLYVSNSFLDFYTSLATTALTLLSVIIGFKGDTILKAHKINIKKYPITQADLQREDNRITLTINSTNSLKKEINNYYYMVKVRKWDILNEADGVKKLVNDNLYHDIQMEKTATGTKIIYQLQKTIDL